MTDFKVGDKVRFLPGQAPLSLRNRDFLTVSEITGEDGGFRISYLHLAEAGDPTSGWFPSRFELVERAPEMSCIQEYEDALEAQDAYQKVSKS